MEIILLIISILLFFVSACLLTGFLVLQKKYKPVKDVLKTKMLRDILHGLALESDVENAVRHHKLTVLQKKFRVAVVEFSDIRALQEAYSSEEILFIQNQIFDEVRDELGKKSDILMVEINYYRAAIMVDMTDDKELCGVLKSILLTCEARYDVGLIGAIGTLCANVSDAKNSFNAAAEMLDGSVRLYGNAVVSVEQDAVDAQVYYYPLEKEKDIIFNIVRRNYAEARAEIGEILVENLARRKLATETLGSFLLAIVNTLNRLIHTIKAEPDDVFGSGVAPYLELKMVGNNDELSSKINSLFDSIVNYLEKNTKNKDSQMSEQLLGYIHNNYQNDISLADISDNFNLSRSYVSTLFKDSTGQNFKDYLNMYRVEIAKESLRRNPKILIKDLTKLVGYNSVNSFIRIFNKYEGMTPGQFVKKSGEAEE